MKKSIIRKPISILLSLVMLLSVFAGMSFTASAANMYQISSYAELKAFANAVNGGATDANAILTADIIAKGTDWTPIGYSYRPYIGTFDGDGHTITGLSTESTAGRDYVGLFGYVGAGGVVQNVGLVGGCIKGQDLVGAVAGCSDGQILNCYNTGEVTATDDSGFVGGVVGATYRGTVQSCYNTGTVSGLNAYAGGVVGLNVEGTVQNCYNTGDVSGAIVGGVAGFNNAENGGRAEISNCFNTGKISGTNMVGGVAGRNNADDYFERVCTATVTNCYNMGEVSVNGAYTDVGGVVGQNVQKTGCSAEVTNCYSAGTVTASGSNSSADGVAGYNNGTVQNCYYDSDVCDANNNIGTRLTTAQMTGDAALSNMPGFAAAAWYRKANAETADIFTWFYPHLRGFAYDTTLADADWYARREESNIMEISDYAGLKAFAAAVNGGRIKLTGVLKSDIAATDKEWTPIGNELKPYVGIFDGDGHTITGLSNEDVANAPINAGLFGWLGENAKVKNVRLTGVDLKATFYLGAVAGDAKGAEITNCRNTGEINCTASQVGGIIGSIRGAIVSNCCNTGDITSTANNAYVGGIAGFLCGDQSAAGITNCYNTGTVTGKGRYSNVGGIAGYANDRNCTVEIANCYNTGAVTATGTSSRAGGIAASSCVFDGGTVEVINCYSAGAVTADQNVGGVIGLKYNSVVRNCYYDSDVCGLSSAIGKIDDTDDVKGLHTDEMTGASALTQMPFSDPSAWLVKGTTNLYEFYPHLKGFDFNADGSQKEASAIDAADWPAKIAHSHTYGEPVWSWEKDHSKATATFTCSGCGDEQTVTDEEIDVTVFSAADCTNDRVVTYTAGVTFAGAPYENAVKNVTLPDTATGHTYGDTGDDRFTCTVCGAEDAARKAAAALADAKAAAKTELENYKDPADYRADEQTDLAAAIADGEAAIDAAADIDAMNAALADAKATIDAIKTDAELTAEELAADTAAADAVEAKIDAIGEVAYTDESKAKIDEARAAYDALTPAQQALVENADVLTAAEARYAELKAEAQTPDEPAEEGTCPLCGNPAHKDSMGRGVCAIVYLIKILLIEIIPALIKLMK